MKNSVLDRIKDLEAAEIINELENNNCDFVLKRKLFDITKQEFDKKDKDMKQLKELVYQCGHNIFCVCFQYSRDDIRRGLMFPGNHDFNVCLSRYFRRAMPFYKEWLDVFTGFIESNGLMYPRYIPEIIQTNNGFCTLKDVLLTKEDIPDGEELRLPNYYRLPDGRFYYASLEDTKAAFKKNMGKCWKEYFERYEKKEYPIIKELSENTEGYGNLPGPVKILPV